VALILLILTECMIGFHSVNVVCGILAISSQKFSIFLFDQTKRFRFSIKRIVFPFFSIKLNFFRSFFIRSNGMFPLRQDIGCGEVDASFEIVGQNRREK